MERDMFRGAVSQKSLGTTGLHVMLHMKHFRVVSYRRRITILAAYDKGCPVNMFTASGRMNLYEGKGFNKAGVCNWLPLYYHAGMYRVPYCYIAVTYVTSVP